MIVVAPDLIAKDACRPAVRSERRRGCDDVERLERRGIEPDRAVRVRITSKSNGRSMSRASWFALRLSGVSAMSINLPSTIEPKAQQALWLSAWVAREMMSRSVPRTSLAWRSPAAPAKK
jgi:hypothetical protein